MAGLTARWDGSEDPLMATGMTSVPSATQPSPAAQAVAKQWKGLLHNLNPFRSDASQPAETQQGLSPAALGGGLTDVAPAASHQPGVAPRPVAQPFKVTMPGGVQYTADDLGNRTYTVGTPGTGGYARAYVAARQPGEPPLPVASPEPASPRGVVYRPTGNMIQARTGSDYDTPISAGGLQAPQYLGPESGLGWKTRLGLYKEQMDAFTRAQGLQTATGIEQLREAGAGQRAGLQAEGVAARNEIDARDVGVREAVGQRLTTAADALTKAKPGTPEYDQALRMYTALSGQGGGLIKEQKRDIRMLDETDQHGNVIRQVPIDLTNPERGYQVIPEADKESATSGDAFLTTLNRDKKLLEAYNALSPAQQAEQRRRFQAANTQPAR